MNLNEWMNGWMNEWILMNEWMNEWMTASSLVSQFCKSWLFWVALYFCELKEFLSGTQFSKVPRVKRGLETGSLLSTGCQMSL